MTYRFMFPCLALIAAMISFPGLSAAEDPAGPPPEPAASAAQAGLQGPAFAQFGAGRGPSEEGGVYRLLDPERTKGQSNAVAFEARPGAAAQWFALKCRLRILEGGEGGAFVFLSTAAYGTRGPAPFLPSWVEPNLRGSFAVAVDVHDPPPPEEDRYEFMFGPKGNYERFPEREVSLHFDGRELVKRVAPAEFRGDFADCEIRIDHVCGGAEVTVKLAGAAVYDRFFVPDLHPYQWRLCVGACTTADAATEFDARDLALESGPPAQQLRPPVRVEVFNHVLTDNARVRFEKEVDLPPLEWAFGRVVLTLEIHDAGPDWDEWDRCGEIWVYDKGGASGRSCPSSPPTAPSAIGRST